MTHSEAVQEMAAERYLLDELTPDARDAFEEHMFDCQECALDVRSGSMFVEEAKAQLPAVVAGSAAEDVRKATSKRTEWFSWLRPAFAVPVFAALLLVMGYQNLVTIPGLHSEADQPRIVPNAGLYGATRGGGHTAITADRAHGIALPVDIPAEAGVTNYASYAFDLVDPQGKRVWSGSVTLPSPQQPGGDQQLSVVIPGSMLQTGTYSLTMFGAGANGSRTELERQVFDLTVTK